MTRVWCAWGATQKKLASSRRRHSREDSQTPTEGQIEVSLWKSLMVLKWDVCPGSTQTKAQVEVSLWSRISVQEWDV